MDELQVLAIGDQSIGYFKILQVDFMPTQFVVKAKRIAAIAYFIDTFRQGDKPKVLFLLV
jgi:hypothetical protein